MSFLKLSCRFWQYRHIKLNISYSLFLEKRNLTFFLLFSEVLAGNDRIRYIN